MPSVIVDAALPYVLFSIQPRVDDFECVILFDYPLKMRQAVAYSFARDCDIVALVCGTVLNILQNWLPDYHF